MKTNRILILFTMLLLLAACHKQEDRYWLDQAEQYLPQQPDSAWRALKRIHFPENLSGKEKADYWLLHAMSRRNRNNSYNNDTLLKESIAYYTSVKDSSRSQEAFRLEAQRQEWLGNLAEADSLYRQAIRFSQHDTIRPYALYDKLIMLHQNHINPKNYPLARQYARQLIAIATPPTWKAHAYYQLAVNYNFEGAHPDSAIYYTYQCLKYVRQLPEKEQAFYLSNCANMIGLDPHEALSLFQESSRISPSSRCANLCSQGYIYLAMGRADSAMLCYQRSMELYKEQFIAKQKEYPTLHNGLTTLYACAQYALHPGDIRTKDFMYNDSIQSASRRAQLMYEENMEARQGLSEKQFYLEIRQQRMRTLLALSACVFILFIAATYIYIRRRKQRWIASEEEIEALEIILEQARANTSEEPATDGAFFRRILLKQLGLIRLIASTPTSANQELLRQFNQLERDTHESSNHLLIWDELFPIIDASYNGFYTALRKTYGGLLNEKEIQLCCLLRTGFSTKEINIVTGQSVSTIYHRKIDIRRKLNLTETGALSEFLLNLQSQRKG